MPEEAEHCTQPAIAVNLFGEKASGARQLFGGSKGGFMQMCDDEEDSQVIA